jgi:hypothetical protein
MKKTTEDRYQDVMEEPPLSTKQEKRIKKIHRKLSVQSRLMTLSEELTVSGEYVETESWNPQQEKATAPLPLTPIQQLNESNPNVSLTQKRVSKKVTPFAEMPLKAGTTLTCGDCEALTVRPIRFKTVCSREGFTECSKICKQFSPNPMRSLSSLGLRKEHHELQRLGDLMAGFPAENLGLLLGLFFCEKKTRALGFRFFQKVYYRWRASSTDNYLSNFVVAHIVDVTEERVRLTTRDGSASMVIFLEGDLTLLEGYGPSFYTEAGFERFQSFIKGKTDPIPTPRIRRSSLDTVRTIDDLVEADVKEESGDKPFVTEKNKGRKKKKVRDLVDIMGEMSRTYHKVSMGYYNESSEEEDEVSIQSPSKTPRCLMTDESDSDVTSLEELREAEGLLDEDDYDSDIT